MILAATNSATVESDDPSAVAAIAQALVDVFSKHWMEGTPLDVGIGVDIDGITYVVRNLDTPPIH